MLDLARYATAAQVEKLVRAYRGVERHEERERASAQHAARELNYYHDEDGSFVIHARLPAEEGAVVLQALNAAMDARKTEESEAEPDDVTAVTSEPSNRFAQRRRRADDIGGNHAAPRSRAAVRGRTLPGRGTRYRGNARRRRTRLLRTR